MVEVHLGALGSRGDLRRKGQWEEIRINSKRQEIKGFEAGSLGSGLEKTVIPDHTRVWGGWGAEVLQPGPWAALQSTLLLMTNDTMCAGEKMWPTCTPSDS